MREALSFTTSAAFHAGAYGLFLVCAPVIAHYYEVQVQQGKAVSLVMVMPVAASQVEETLPPVEIEVPPEETKPAELQPQEMELEKPEPVTADERPALVEVSALAAVPPPAATKAITEPDEPPPAEPPATEPLPKTDTKPQATVSSDAVPYQADAELGVDVEELPKQVATNRPPIYPAAALNARLQGRVVVLVTVKDDGSVGAAKIHASSGHADFDASALAAVGQWRFKPAIRNGQAVQFEILAPINFVLREGKPAF
jgi:protein TonB